MAPESIGRHRASSAPKNRTGVIVAATATSVAAALGVAALIIKPWEDGKTATVQTTATQTQQVSGNSGQPAATAETIRIWTGRPGDPLVNKLGGLTVPGGQGYRAVAAASPAQADVELVTADTSTAEAPTSPLVLAMPARMAAVFGLPTTANLQRWVLGQQTFAAAGHPEWGSFSITVPDPKTSVTGAVGYGALLTTVNGAPLTGGIDYSKVTPAMLAMVRVEHRALVVPDDSAAQALLAKPDVAAFARTTSAVLTTERAVVAANAAGGQKYVALPLLGGAAAVPVTARTTASGTSNALAKAFVTALNGAAGTAALQAAGFRNSTGAAAAGSGLIALRAPTPVAAPAVQQLRGAWSNAHRRNSTLALLDMSGSMGSRFPGSDVSKVEMLKRLITLAYTVASPKAHSGSWMFANRPGGPLLGPISLGENTPAHVQQVTTSIAKARPLGGTPLYLAIQRAYDHATKNYTPGMTNQVLVLSDGANGDAGNTVTLAQARAYVAKLYNPKKPIAINMVLTNPGENTTELKQIAAVTKGLTIPINSPADVSKVFNSTIFN